jgi:hypothetical protein
MSGTLAYLATPYARYPGGPEKAFIDAACITSRLLMAGVNVYSPITHSHSLSVYGGLKGGDHAFWLPYDELMMSRCDTLIVAHMEGWQESKGIAHEIEFFRRMRKPIFDLVDLTTLRMDRRKDEFMCADHQNERVS